MEKLCINGGKRGYLVGLAPQHVQQLLKPINYNGWLYEASGECLVVTIGETTGEEPL